MENKSEHGKIKIESPKYPPTIADYYNNIIKAFGKYIGIDRSDYTDTSDTSETIPDIIPANGYDIYNYIAKYGIASFQVQIIMKMDDRLDFDKLVRAVRLSLDVEPVLGCKFVRNDPPYWKRFDDIDNIEFCSIEETYNSDEAVEKFLEGPMDMDNDPMVKVKLIRSRECDTLGLKINHVCCDGAGAKEYIHLLSNIYSSIDSGDNVFVPKPNLRNRKDHERLVGALSECNPWTSYTPIQQLPLTTWKFPWKNMKTGDTGFTVCRLPEGYFDIINNYAKARGATINDMVLTAIYRAMFDIAKPLYGIPMDVCITTDLRKYLPEHKAEAIRNFSGGAALKIDRRMNESFEGTLFRVMAVTKDLKYRHPSLQNAIRVGYFEKISFHSICAYFRTISKFYDLIEQNPFVVINRCGPVLSNLGLISKPLIKFGETTVTDAYVIPPAIRAPGILIVAGTYNGVVTLSVAYYKSSVQKSDMERLLNKIRDELVEGCKQ